MTTNIILLNISLFAYLMHMIWKIRKCMHILQLNSYQTDRYLRWMMRNMLLFTWMDLLPAASIPIYAYNGIAVWAIVWIICCISIMILHRLREQQEKKPLTMTDRVRRMWLTIAIFFVIPILALNLRVDTNSPALVFASLIALSTTSILAALLLALANIVNGPMERAIQSYYIRDAKRILALMPSLRVIGITGSCGKTTTKEILGHILSEKYYTLVTPASYNTTMGVVRTIREQLKPVHEVFVVEMGARRSGDIADICQLVAPEFGIITTITEQHLETFKTIDNIVRTKLELVDYLPKEGLAVLNGDDERIRNHKTTCHQILFGLDADNYDFCASNITANSEGSSFTITRKGKEQQLFRTRLLGKHSILNILAATSVACEMGISLADAARAVHRLRPTEHRLELRKTSGSITILDDSYNSNPVGAIAALDVLASFRGYTKVLLTPGMVELGDRESYHNKAFGYAAAKICDLVILVGPQRTIPIRDGLKEGLFPSEKIHEARNLNDALDIMHSALPDNSIVLIENDLPDDYDE